jgi:hypothetical protein
MAGMPMHRARALVNTERKAHKPLIPWNRWRLMPDAEKFAYIAGFSLDDALRFQSIPFEDADIHERKAKLEVFQAMVKLGTQHFRDKERRADQLELLETVGAALRARTRSPSSSDAGSPEHSDPSDSSDP